MSDKKRDLARRTDGAVEVVALGDFIDPYSVTCLDDLRRVKAALLYGDRVTLESPWLTILIGRMAHKARVLPAMFAENWTPDIAEAVAREVAERRGLSDDEIPELASRFFPELADTLAEFAKDKEPLADDQFFLSIAPVAIDNLLRRVDIPEAEARYTVSEFETLVRERAIEVDLGGIALIPQSASDDAIPILNGALSRFYDLLSDRYPASHPLLTENEKLILRSEASRPPDVSVSRANRVELAVQLIGKLPSFQDADADEVLDVRKAVQPYLARFQSQVLDFEKSLNSDVDLASFDVDVQDLYVSTVAPALEELEQSLGDIGAISTLSRAAVPSAGSVVGLGVAVAAGAPTLSMAAAVGAGAIAAAANEVLVRKKAHRERTSNRLFLLFEAERRLSRR